MDYKQLFVILAITTVMLPACCMAKDFIVGDERGWTTGFDYKTWTAGKDFRVGDKLIFKYQEGAHNVFKVNGTGFRDCLVPPANEALTTGNDSIILATPGRKWYICGVAKHCEKGGQKLFITVQPQQSIPPTMPPSVLAQAYASSANSITEPLMYHSVMAAAIVMFAWIIRG